MACGKDFRVNMVPLKPSDYSKALALYHEEGWTNVSEYHMQQQGLHLGANTFIAAYTEDGVLLATCGAAMLDKDHAYMDYVKVAKNYQRQGLGKDIVREALTLLGSRNTILDSVLECIPFYENHFGFKQRSRLFLAKITDSTCVQESSNPTIDDKDRIEEITPSNLNEVMIYDQTLHTFGYRTYYEVLLMNQNNPAFCSKDDLGAVNGIILFLGDYSAISSLFVENELVARQLLKKLFVYLSSTGICHGRDRSMIIPEEHVETMTAIIEDLGLEAPRPEYILCRMTNYHDAPIDLKKLYGLSNFQGSCL